MRRRPAKHPRIDWVTLWLLVGSLTLQIPHAVKALPRLEPCRSLMVLPAQLEAARGLMRYALENAVVQGHPHALPGRLLQILVEPIEGGEWLLTLFTDGQGYRLVLAEAADGSILVKHLDSLEQTGSPAELGTFTVDLFDSELSADLAFELEKVLTKELEDRREQVLIAIHEDYYSIIGRGGPRGFTCGQVTSAISAQSRLNALIDLFDVLSDLAIGRGDSDALEAKARQLLSSIAQSRTDLTSD